MKKLLQKAGVYVLAMIEDNIAKGIDSDGKKYSYSENNYVIPFDKKLYSKLKNNKDVASVIHRKNNKLGFVIHGYKKFKKFVYPDSADDFLTVRGDMLNDMKVIKTTDEESIIGFNNSKEAQKAYWFNVSGVGPSRKLWKFLNITNKQKDELANKLGIDFKNLMIEEFGKIIDKNKQ